MKFWDVVKEVSAQPVRDEANRLFLLALAGDPEAVRAAQIAALGPDLAISGEGVTECAPFLLCASPPYSDEEERKLRHADLIVSLPGGPSLTDFRPADTIQVERIADLQRAVLARKPGLRLALARRLPGFRDLAAEQVIRDVSRVNAEVAVVSGVSTAIPFLAPLFPAMAGADILLLTKNQVLMIFRLAAIYGEEMDLKTRAREIIPVIGGALGWRTLARQLAGLLPGGLGLPLRASIAYSGTFATGRAAQMVFDSGRRPTRQEMLRIYEEGARQARELADRIRSRVGKDRNAGEPQKALPEPKAEVPEEEPSVPEEAQTPAPGR